MGIAFSDLAVRWGFDYSIAGVSFVHPDVECSGMNTDVSVRRCVMGYRLVTGLYVTNYICLAPELLLTGYGSR